MAKQGPFSIKINPDLNKWIRSEAKRENRSFNNKVEEILQREMDYRT